LTPVAPAAVLGRLMEPEAGREEAAPDLRRSHSKKPLAASQPETLHHASGRVD
jgi:hypothetical protein